MLRLNFRIGTKLALVSALGLVLVAALVIANRLANQHLDELTRELAVSAQVLGNVNDSNIAIRNVRIAYRDARLANTVEEVDHQLGAIERQTATVDENLKAALRQAALAANRQRLQKAHDQLGPYLAAYKEVVSAQRELLLERAKLTGLSAEWNKNLDAIRTHLAHAPGPDATELLLLIERADNAARDTRLAVWRFQATAEATLKARADRSTVESLESLKAAAQKATDRQVAATLAALIGQVPAAETAVAALIAARVRQEEVATKRANPLAEALVEEFKATQEAAEARTNDIMTEVDRAITEANTFGLVLGALVVVVLIGSAAFGNIAIARPIRRIADVLAALGRGDKTVAVPYADRGDEVGDAAKAADTFKANLLRIDRFAADQKSAEAHAEAEKRAALMSLADNFEGAVGGIVRTVTNAATQLQSAAQGMSAAAEETSHQAVAVASASEQASSNVQTVASAAEELTTSVGEISRQVEESSRIAGDAVREANDTVTKVSRLSASAQKIGDVVGLISTIAAQTNLLALNATIEAARAGDAGRGFAVVASEVKSLADQTAKATAEISAVIAEIQGSTAESATAIGAITETIRRMNAISSTVAAAVEEQGAATREIARNVQQASEGTREVSANISGVTRAASDSSTASSEVLSSAGALAEQAERLAAEVREFLTTVRGGSRAA